MKERSFDEMIAYFNRRVSEMDIARDYKIELLGMIAALGYKHEKTAQQWIPCSERLPENNRQVLVYARSVHFALAKYDEMRNANGIYEMQWVTFDAWKPFYKIKEVIAWMPLPEPYKERWEK